MSSSGPRYALYVAPASDDPLHEFAARWLGWDAASGQAYAATAAAGLDARQQAALTTEPRHYGFHGTLKPPFRLAPDKDEAGLLAALEHFTQSRTAFALPSLRVAALGQFLAMQPSAPCPLAEQLAADCVREFDIFRAAAGAAELAKRRAAGLSARQEAYLLAWGYPYVLEEFRLHFTLTGRIADAAEREQIRAYLHAATADFTRQEFPVSDICLFVQREADQPFRIERRFALRG